MSQFRNPVNCKDLNQSECKSNNVMCEYYFDSNDENGTCVPRPDNLVSHIEKGNIPEVIRTLEVISGEKNVKDVFMKVLDLSSKLWVSGVAEKLILFNRNIGNPVNRRYGNPMGEQASWTKEMVTSFLEELKSDGMCSQSDCSLCFSPVNEHKDSSKIIKSECCGHMSLVECNTESFNTCVGCHRDKVMVKKIGKKHIQELLDFMMNLPRSEDNIDLGSKIMMEMDQKYTILAGGMTEAINNMVDIQDRELDELRQEELELNEIERQEDLDLLEDLRQLRLNAENDVDYVDNILLFIIIFFTSFAGMGFFKVGEAIPDVNAKFGWEITVVIVASSIISKLLYDKIMKNV